MGGGFAIWYSQIPQCPESCDDGNPCTKDFCSSETDYRCQHSQIAGPTEGCQGLVETCLGYQCIEGECQLLTFVDCCGNKKCEKDEDWNACPEDCESCDDKNPCTLDYSVYEPDYQCKHSFVIGPTEGCKGGAGTCLEYQCAKGKCESVTVANCCGNKRCEAGESYITCPVDCISCDLTIKVPTIEGFEKTEERTEVTMAEGEAIEVTWYKFKSITYEWIYEVITYTFRDCETAKNFLEKTTGRFEKKEIAGRTVYCRAQEELCITRIGNVLMAIEAPTLDLVEKILKNLEVL